MTIIVLRWARSQVFYWQHFCIDKFLGIYSKQVIFIIKKQEQKMKNTNSVAWVYDDEHGWINVSLFLKRIKKLEKDLYAKLQKTG